MKKSVLAIFLGILTSSLNAYSGQTMQPDTTAYGQPLRLSSFRVRIISASKIELNWITAETWTTVTHYEIQRSLNNRDFSAVGAINQTNNNPVDQSYLFTDDLSNVSGATTVYYRLRQVNRDGRESFSFVIPAKLQWNAENGVNLWPNPVKEELNVGFSNDFSGTITVRIFDISGKKVMEQQYQAGKGLNIIKLEQLKTITAGVHILQVWANDTLVGTRKFLKQTN
jgi:hypothetical protein